MGEVEEDGGEESGTSDDKAVVGAALRCPEDVDDELAGKGGILPPEKREDELDRDPGRNGDGTLGECDKITRRVGEFWGTDGTGEGVLVFKGESGC